MFIMPEDPTRAASAPDFRTVLSPSTLLHRLYNCSRHQPDRAGTIDTTEHKNTPPVKLEIERPAFRRWIFVGMVNISDAALKWIATNILVKKWFDHWVQWIQYEYWGSINLYHHPCTWPLRQQVCPLCAWLQISHNIPGESESYFLSVFTNLENTHFFSQINNIKLKNVVFRDGRLYADCCCTKYSPSRANQISR